MSNVFSFLIATDCHLGFEENNHIIGDDSFITFEEILLKAIEQDVDLILLGGDLFHHNNPSQKCMNKCIELLRRYTLGDKPVYFELLSNASEVFCNSISETTNYLDDNINVSIPVFSIHGNHDDPSGTGHFSALDTLSSAGLINYFGKWTDLEDVIIKPILLRKGKTKIALYGLSHIKDDRLCRLFMAKKVTFVQPDVDPDGWFNIFILHQNRVDRGPKRFIAESWIPEFLDLVIWGHEHDCEIEPLKNVEKGFYVIQPGSSVATSLTDGEALPKHIATIKIFEKKMKVTPLRLNTVRPFVYKNEKLWDIMVTSENRETKSEEIKIHCMQVVEEMIREADRLRTGHPKQPILPLIRLRCEYSDETQLFNVIKFGQLFHGRVANPNGEIVRLKRSSVRAPKKEKSEDLMRLSELYKDNMEEAYNFSTCINHIVTDYFTNHEESKMLIMKVSEISAAVERFIDKDDVLALEELVDKKIQEMLKELKQQKVNGDDTNLSELFQKMRDENEKAELKEEKNFEKNYEKMAGKQKVQENLSGIIHNDGSNTSDEEFFSNPNASKKITDILVSESDTDEYDVEQSKNSIFSSNSSFLRNKKESNNDSDKDSDRDSDNEFFGRKTHRNTKNTLGEEKKTQRGRGRGRGRQRAVKETNQKASRTISSSRVAKTKPTSQTSNLLLYEDDSD